MLNLNENLKWARIAGEYVNKKIPDDWLNYLPNKSCAQSIRKALGPVGEKDKNFCDVVRTWAARGSKFGCGNCAEQAALAFVYLDDHGIVPIDYMGFVKRQDHAFVVVGRAQHGKVEDPRAWGGAAVVCDPYYEEYYPVNPITLIKRIHKKRMSGDTMRVICRKSRNEPRVYESLRVGVG